MTSCFDSTLTRFSHPGRHDKLTASTSTSTPTLIILDQIHLTLARTCITKTRHAQSRNFTTIDPCVHRHEDAALPRKGEMKEEKTKGGKKERGWSRVTIRLSTEDPTHQHNRVGCLSSPVSRLLIDERNPTKRPTLGHYIPTRGGGRTPVALPCFASRDKAINSSTRG